MKSIETIKEVEEMKDKLGKRLDSKIKDLVIGLRMLGIETLQSCEGHLDWGNPYPWVMILSTNKNKVFQVVQWHNTKGRNRIFWVILPKGNHIIIMPAIQDEKFSLEELQESAVHFGKKLQENFPGFS